MRSIFHDVFEGRGDSHDELHKRQHQSFDDHVSAVFHGIHSLSSGDLLGAESLVRWHEMDVQISPLQLVDALTQANLSDRLAIRMIDASAQMVKHSSKTLDVFVNICPSHMESFDVLEHFSKAADEYQVSRERLHLELTETGTISRSVISSLEELKDAGHQILIDDFGAGESTTKRIIETPVTGIKIDRSLIWNASDPGSTGYDAARREIDRVLDYTDIMGLSVTAEGIETEEILHCCMGMGINVGQGFLFGKPCPMNDFDRGHQPSHTPSI